MGAKSADDMELDDRDRDVLRVLLDGRANPYHIRQRTEMDKGDINTVLNRLGRSGYVNQVDRGLYEITPQGESEMNADHPTHIGFLRDTETFQDAEDVVTVRLTGDRGTVDVKVTDESMVEFVETAEQAFDDIHAGMAQVRDILNRPQEDDDS